MKKECSLAHSKPHGQKSKERALYLSLWLILLMGLVFWRMLSSSQPASPPPPEIQLSAELGPIFQTVQIIDSTRSTFQLKLFPTARYLETLRSGESRRLEIAYEFHGSQWPLFTGSTPLLLKQGAASAIVELDNPKRIWVDRIRLFLAH